MNSKISMKMEQSAQNVQVLQGRLTAAKWLSMSEPEVTGEVKNLESDPLFSELMYGRKGQSPVLRRRRWPAAGMHSGFYQLNEDIARSSGDGDISDILEKKGLLIEKIRSMGVDNFERYFLYGEEGRPLPEVCEEVGVSEEEGRRILDLVLEIGARSEFFVPGATPETSGLPSHCIASIEKDPRSEENLFFRFLTPHWARGRYEIHYEELEKWKNRRELTKEENRRLKTLLKRMELLNMRQDTLFQILSRVTTEQSAYLRSRKEVRLRPLSLRELARRIGVAPSTVSRAVSNRSVRVPWGADMSLKSLLTGQRVVIMAILTDWMSRGLIQKTVTDEALMRRLADENAITVSRRTVNECRRLLPR